jgi:sugar transferase (PEP-CTERM/EpsH1 system associated)
MTLDIVFLSQRVPYPPDRGDRISTYHFLRHFRESGARIRVGALAEDDRDEAAVKELQGLVHEVVAPRIRPRTRKLWSLRGLLTGEPLTLPYFSHPALHRAVERWVGEAGIDLVYLYSSSMAQYVLGRGELTRVMHFAELDSDKWRQYAAATRGPAAWIFRREARTLLEFEREVARNLDASIVVSPAERDLFVEYIPDVVPEVIPNGVDVQHFSSRGEEERDRHSVIFTGVMDYEPNVDGVLWFAREIWPRVRAEFPAARFLVVGNRPVPQIRRLDGHHGVEVTGWVPETPPWFDRAAVAVAPLRLARGLQNKVLEAMSMGLPVVATSAAARGLGRVDGDTLCVADDEEHIGRAVADFLRDPAGARRTGARASAWVREHFLWEHQFARLDELLGRLGVQERASLRSAEGRAR